MVSCHRSSPIKMQTDMCATATFTSKHWPELKLTEQQWPQSVSSSADRVKRGQGKEGQALKPGRVVRVFTTEDSVGEATK